MRHRQNFNLLLLILFLSLNGCSLGNRYNTPQSSLTATERKALGELCGRAASVSLKSEGLPSAAFTLSADEDGSTTQQEYLIVLPNEKDADDVRRKFDVFAHSFGITYKNEKKWKLLFLHHWESSIVKANGIVFLSVDPATVDILRADALTVEKQSQLDENSVGNQKFLHIRYSKELEELADSGDEDARLYLALAVFDDYAKFSKKEILKTYQWLTHTDEKREDYRNVLKLYREYIPPELLKQ